MQDQNTESNEVKEEPQEPEREVPVEDEPQESEREIPVEEAEHPVPGIVHKPEPDAENIMPAEDQPGTL